MKSVSPTVVVRTCASVGDGTTLPRITESVASVSVPPFELPLSEVLPALPLATLSVNDGSVVAATARKGVAIGTDDDEISGASATSGAVITRARGSRTALATASGELDLGSDVAPSGTVLPRVGPARNCAGSEPFSVEGSSPFVAPPRSAAGDMRVRVASSAFSPEGNAGSAGSESPADASPVINGGVPPRTTVCVSPPIAPTADGELPLVADSGAAGFVEPFAAAAVPGRRRMR